MGGPDIGADLPMYFATIPESPVGPIIVAGSENGLKIVSFQSSHPKSAPLQPKPEWQENERLFRDCIRQLKAYFSGKLTRFDLPLDPDGTDFQKRVWKALVDVPFGTTATYGEIARAIGQPAASRAVGMANGRNPIAIVVPCHRIIGTSGKLVGYGGGLDKKVLLLRLENAAFHVRG